MQLHAARPPRLVRHRRRCTALARWVSSSAARPASEATGAKTMKRDASLRCLDEGLHDWTFGEDDGQNKRLREADIEAPVETEAPVVVFPPPPVWTPLPTILRRRGALDVYTIDETKHETLVRVMQCARQHGVFDSTIALGHEMALDAAARASAMPKHMRFVQQAIISYRLAQKYAGEEDEPKLTLSGLSGQCELAMMAALGTAAYLTPVDVIRLVASDAGFEPSTLDMAVALARGALQDIASCFCAVVDLGVACALCAHAVAEGRVLPPPPYITSRDDLLRAARLVCAREDILQYI